MPSSSVSAPWFVLEYVGMVMADPPPSVPVHETVYGAAVKGAFGFVVPPLRTSARVVFLALMSPMSFAAERRPVS